MALGFGIAFVLQVYWGIDCPLLDDNNYFLLDNLGQCVDYCEKSILRFTFRTVKNCEEMFISPLGHQKIMHTISGVWRREAGVISTHAHAAVIDAIDGARAVFVSPFRVSSKDRTSLQTTSGKHRTVVSGGNVDNFIHKEFSGRIPSQPSTHY